MPLSLPALWHWNCGPASAMLEVARPETRTHIRSHPGRLGWGVVDVILAIVMLPFAIWMLMIEGMVTAIARLQRS